MRIRLFLALELSDEVRANIAKLQDVLKTAAQFSGAEPSWVKPESIHLTIKFLGWTDDEIIEPLSALLEPKLAALSPFTFGVRGTGVFPNPVRPRVIWTAVRKADEELTALFSIVEEQTATLGFAPEERAFHPHLTLARIKSQKGVQGLMKTVEQHGRDWCGETHAMGLNLYQSNLHPSGAIYTKLRIYPFKGQ